MELNKIVWRLIWRSCGVLGKKTYKLHLQYTWGLEIMNWTFHMLKYHGSFSLCPQQMHTLGLNADTAAKVGMTLGWKTNKHENLTNILGKIGL